MFQISAGVIFFFGFCIGALIGAMGIIICAFKFSKGEKDGNKKDRV